MQTTYETLSLMLTFGLLLIALQSHSRMALPILDNRNNKRKK